MLETVVGGRTLLRLVGDTAALQEVGDGDRPSFPYTAMRTLMGDSITPET